jgi:hypothetical protein
MIEQIEEKVRSASKYNIKDLQKKTIESTSVDGLFLEFGVYQGESIKYLSSLTENTFYGFDSFEGLPEDWGTWMKKGTFHLKEIPDLQSEKVKLVVGFFDKTIDKFMQEHSQNISFIHIDCDLYSSTKTIFDKMKNRFVSGTVILFDEIINYPIYKEHEIKAFAEFLEETRFNIECIGNSFLDNNKQRASFILL